ncbi:Flagellar biosynthetic protein FlhB, export component [Nitrospira sp. KM1]|uniref:flagellar biosynthesis protein FlhB n=1 Tax=Nitrospira sp. KM1 TaxID=1936990 RepID=UPI0013A7A658|nr:flagellar biosynthesis protein FlhB [Nitrospira sp. KM1]BCA54802.1 Flagellar biosynthetic protein FlhB, export component [Nitrospira sp. KM1]
MADLEGRTEQATPKRRAQARARGEVAVSRDVSSAAALLGALGLFYVFARPGMTKLNVILRDWLTSAADAAGHRTLTVDAVQQMALKTESDLLMLIMPFIVGVALCGVAASLAQTGFLWKTEGLGFNLAGLNPLTGLGRICSTRSLAELVKSCLKVVCVGGAGFYAVRADLPLLPELVQYSLDGMLAVIGWMMFKAALSISLAVAVVAAMDYGYQRFEFERKLRMTKEEVKEEQRDAEGDPQIRSRIRTVQRDLARKRMLADVKTADVIVTNPDHLAVAIRYDQHKMAAPIVVAKGAGYLAQKIKEIGRANGVVVIENKFVARTLYKLVDIGREIPSDLYRAVAEILAFVYRVRGMVPGRHP